MEVRTKRQHKTSVSATRTIPFSCKFRKKRESESVKQSIQWLTSFGKKVTSASRNAMFQKKSFDQNLRENSNPVDPNPERYGICFECGEIAVIVKDDHIVSVKVLKCPKKKKEQQKSKLN